jgi:uncharacterized radical SAM superfamily Fe-S cluster-containing enzyme
LKNINGISVKYNLPTLQKIEKLIAESLYILRNERGTFQSGYCLLEQKKVIVINKFLNVEGKINTLLEIIPELQIDLNMLSVESKKLYGEVIEKFETAAAAKAS